MFILRVDDRLIHGQVVAGWARPLGINTLILVSDTICNDEWACNAYRLAIPEGIEFYCVTLEQSRRTIVAMGTRQSMVIVASVREAYHLLRDGLDVQEVNIGGLSYHDGTREVAPYIHLTRDDIDAVVQLYQMGIKVIGKQLPNSSTIDVVKTLAGVK
ncbi:PTS sugar transporter subunit IIB [candidate division WOR-3 bacterium]|nr:PTS sugar transporter subunit IIB [candidate division WOR-3 bacterium]